MEHNTIDLKENSEVTSLVIYQEDNNLDKLDNLSDLPNSPAVYAICGSVNGQPVNPRFVGETDNLQKSIRSHFNKASVEEEECFKEFMHSIKIKVLVYQIFEGSTKEERKLEEKKWKEKYQPKCNSELNKIH